MKIKQCTGKLFFWSKRLVVINGSEYNETQTIIPLEFVFWALRIHFHPRVIWGEEVWKIVNVFQDFSASALFIFEAIFIIVRSLPCIDFAGLEMPVELFLSFSLVATETVPKYRQISPERLNSPLLRTKDYYIHLFLLWQFATGIKLFSPNLKEIGQSLYLCCKTKAHDDFMIYKEGYIWTAQQYNLVYGE